MSDGGKARDKALKEKIEYYKGRIHDQDYDDLVNFADSRLEILTKALHNLEGTEAFGTHSIREAIVLQLQELADLYSVTYHVRRLKNE